jgi:hypothetical protein
MTKITQGKDTDTITCFRPLGSSVYAVQCPCGPCVISRFCKSTLTKTGSYTNPCFFQPGEEASLVTDGKYLYAAYMCVSNRTHLDKVCPSSMAKISSTNNACIKGGRVPFCGGGLAFVKCALFVMASGKGILKVCPSNICVVISKISPSSICNASIEHARVVKIVGP